MKGFTSVVFALNCLVFLLGATIKYHMEKYVNRAFNCELVEYFSQDLHTDDNISGAQ